MNKKQQYEKLSILLKEKSSTKNDLQVLVLKKYLNNDIKGIKYLVQVCYNNSQIKNFAHATGYANKIDYVLELLKEIDKNLYNELVIITL